MRQACGFWSGETALTKAREPSARRQRAASPGEKPPAWFRASTTGAPSRSSIAVRPPDGARSASRRWPAQPPTSFASWARALLAGEHAPHQGLDGLAAHGIPPLCVRDRGDAVVDGIELDVLDQRSRGAGLHVGHAEGEAATLVPGEELLLDLDRAERDRPVAAHARSWCARFDLLQRIPPLGPRLVIGDPLPHALDGHVDATGGTDPDGSLVDPGERLGRDRLHRTSIS